MDKPKSQKEFRPNPSSATHVRDREFVPIDPLVQRDLDLREITGIFRLILGLAVAVAVFLIAVFGILGAVAHTVGDVLGLHTDYYDVVGSH